MIELTRLSQVLIDEPQVPRPTLDDLRSRSRARRLRRQLQAVGAVVVFVVVAFGAVTLAHSPSSTTPPATELTSYFQNAVSVPNATLESVGLPSTVAIPTRVTPSLTTVSTNDVVSYVGAEYCPYCALQRWALLVALSKFGTFNHLDSQVFSSSSDVYPHLASWSFVGATYSSKYFAFVATELTSSTPSKSDVGGHQQLERMTRAQRIAYHRYDAQGEIPFVDVGNQFVTLGASSSPSVLEGLTLSQIGSDLNSATSPVARAIDGSANYFTAALCAMIQKSAPTICSSSLIRAATAALNVGASSSAGPTSATFPAQPPTNAPLSVWKKWSVAAHRFLLQSAATFRPSNPTCTVSKISVTGRKSSKQFMGIPAGIWTWALSISGHCPPGTSDGLIKHS